MDIGCNIGTTSLPIAKRFPDINVYAVDAHPIASARFIENARLNKLLNVHFLNAAIAQYEKIVRIYSEPKNSGGNRITGFEGRDDLSNLKMWDNISVPSVRLDKVFEIWGINNLRLLMVDVEGYEMQVISSLASLLTPDLIEIVVLEYGPEGMRVAGHTGWEMVDMMRRAGYQCCDLHNGKRIDKVEDIPIIADFTTTDFLFAKQIKDIL